MDPKAAALPVVEVSERVRSEIANMLARWDSGRQVLALPGPAQVMVPEVAHKYGVGVFETLRVVQNAQGLDRAAIAQVFKEVVEEQRGGLKTASPELVGWVVDAVEEIVTKGFSKAEGKGGTVKACAHEPKGVDQPKPLKDHDTDVLPEPPKKSSTPLEPFETPEPEHKGHGKKKGGKS